MTVEELERKYKYRKLDDALSKSQRELYLSQLPKDFILTGDNECQLYYKGVRISNGYNRIVIGDYGAYIEITPEQIEKKNLLVKPGQEYRFEPKYDNIKYYWYCLQQDYSIKIYYQKNTVTYADYKIGMYYTSPINIEVRK